MTLRDCDRPFWNAIIAGRAREEWRDIDLSLAVLLARVQSDYVTEIDENKAIEVATAASTLMHISGILLSPAEENDRPDSRRLGVQARKSFHRR